MYVLVDRGQMCITHKHSSRAVLNDLSWLECTNNAVTIPLGNVKLWAEFTASELKLIYKNATGAELQGYGTALAQAVSDMAKRLPDSVVNAEEVHIQRMSVMDGDKSCYQYAAGAKVPICHHGLFEPPSLCCERVEAEEARCASSRPAYTPAPGGGTGPASTAVNPTGASATVAAPKPGGTREVIFRVADEMWAALGSTTDVRKVLELRKQIMTTLEADHGIKKTTSSTALGDWQKTRLS